MAAKLQMIGSVFCRSAGIGEEGMGERPAPVQMPRAVVVTGRGAGVNVVCRICAVGDCTN